MERTDPGARFTSTAEDYRRHRPGYPAELVDWVLAEAGTARAATVVDVGCGTGISSRLFAERGLEVVGVDPNPAMLAAARRAEGAPRYVRGVAERLPLADGRAGAAVSGQAFHWLDLDRALPELARVLRPGATCAAFWNVRLCSTPFLESYERLLLERCPEYPVASVADTVAALRAHRAVTRPREASFPHAQRFDRQGLVGRAWSSSYVANGTVDAACFDAALNALFDRFHEAGEVVFHYRTVAIAFVPAE